MNLVIIGGKNPKALADVLYSNFDDMTVVSYPTILEFMDAVAMRNLDIHRMLLLQDGIDSNAVADDNEVFNFSNLILQNFPAIKIITICKDMEMAEYLSQLFIGPNNAHFCFVNIKAKILTDLASLDINVLNKKYANYRFVPKKEVKEEIIEDNIISPEENMEISNDQVPGYIPRQEPVEEKRGVLGKVFGFAPKKKKNKLVNNNLPQNIGQGYNAVQDFTQPNDNMGNDFQNPDYDPYGSADDGEIGKIDVFNVDDNDVDLGIGENIGVEKEKDNDIYANLDKPEEPMVHADLEKHEENDDTPDIDFDMEAEFNKQAHADLEKHDIEEPIEPQEEFKPTLDLNVEEKKDIPMEDMNIDIPLPNVDLSNLKDRIENMNVNVNPENFEKRPIMPQVPLEEKTDDDNIDMFTNGLDDLMQEYENSNQKVVERVVEREVVKVVNVGEQSFRNKNGIRTLIVTGDRRVGATKLSLNLASLFSQREKVLYVDFDRNRHGSLGYLDLDNILDSEEHVQNGLAHLKSLNILSNVVYTYRKSGFDCLLSMYGEYVDDNQMKTVQQVLAKQQSYTTVIIDCPIENLYLLGDIVYTSKVLICAEDNKVGLINLMTMLSSCSGDSRFFTALYNNSYFVVGRSGNFDKFQRTLNKVLDVFEIEEYDWNTVEIIGNLKDMNQLLGRLES